MFNDDSSTFNTQIICYTYHKVTKTITAQIKIYNLEAILSTTKFSTIDTYSIDIGLETVDYDFNKLDFNAASNNKWREESKEAVKEAVKMWVNRPLTIDTEV